MEKIKLLSLFSGIGAFEEALDNLKYEYELVNYSEYKSSIAKAYSLIHNEPIEKNLGDITKVDEKTIPDFDLMTYGFPCQDISTLGDQKGFFDKNGNLTRSGLFFDAMRIAKEKKPKFMIAENVKNLVSKKMAFNFKQMISLLDEIGYNTYVNVLNSKNYGIPQSRNRVFIVSIRKDLELEFEFPNPTKLEQYAPSFYQKGEIPDEFYLNEKQHRYFNEFRLKKKYSSINAKIIICMTTKQGTRTNPQNFVQDEKGFRIFTDSEYFALQGFKREYGDLLKENGFSTNQIGFMCGNSITVNVVQAILKNLFEPPRQSLKDFIDKI